MKVQVTGDLGAASVSLDAPVRTAKVAYADLIRGDGEPITSPEQFAILNRTLVSGATGDVIHAAISFWSPETASAEFAGIDEALACATVGSRVVVALPLSALPEGAAAQLGLRGNDSLLAIYDVRAAMLPHAEGSAVFSGARGLPTVVRAADGRPGIIVPDSAAPKKAVTQTLIKGSGEVVGDRAPVILSTSVDWKTQDVVDSSWGGAVTGVDGLPEEAQDAVKKATVGSQLMLVVPDEAGDATVYVIDVLGIVPEELTGQ